MPDWLTILLPAITGLVGALGGAWVSQRGAEKLTKQTLDGQRTLANDASIREWRRQQVAPYREAANQRAQLWIELLMETAIHEGLSLEKSLERDASRHPGLTDLREMLADSRFLSLRLTSKAFPDEAFRDAFEQLQEAEQEGTIKVNHTADEIAAVMARMASALTALNEAAERYIFSTPGALQ
jgi:hypothetical protein